MTASGTHRGLWLRFVLLVGMAAVLVFAVYFAWTAQAESSENERRALAEARTLSAQMDASWDYIDSIQERINYTHGVFDFKDVYCSVAGKAIAVRFTDRTDYSIRYVRENPRSGTDVPDDFERAALASFERGADEYFAMTDYEGSPAFRYVSVLRAEPGCLSCHGAPAGEKDVTGFIKEGMAAQDVAGAVSIVLPMGTIQAEPHADLAAAVVFFCVLMAVVTVILGWGLSRWVAFPIVSENDKLRREAESQSNFLSIVTHELKTPLAAIIALTELWRRRCSSATEEEARIMDDIEMNSHLLLGQINNVLDTVRLDEGCLGANVEDVDVYDVVALVRRVAEPLSLRQGISFTATVEPGIPIVRADREMLRRISMNLVGNAVRYTDAGGSVALCLSWRAGVLVIDVRDTGAGIAPEEIPFVFDRFVSKPGSQHTGEGGTGLGLSIVKRYAEAVGGSVEVRSELGCGSQFVVELPLETAAHPEEEDR